jgi:hypothetical protein
MKTKFKKPLVGLLIVLTTAMMFGLAKSDQPQSTITPSDEQYALSASGKDLDNNVTLTTTERPTPDCAGDTPNGSPDFYWDFGMLDGEDNLDGTATIYDDIVVEDHVTVYCSQSFTGRKGTYTEQTQISN